MVTSANIFNYNLMRKVSLRGEAHLDDNTWRLGEIPEWQAKKTHEGCLGLIRLRAASAENAAT